MNNKNKNMIHQNKEKGLAPLMVVFLIIIAAAAIGGTLYYFKKGTFKSPDGNALGTFPESSGQRGDFNSELFSTTTSESLLVGEEVVVRGTTNQDGSITAKAIYLGLAGEDLESMFLSGPGANQSAEGSEGTDSTKPDFPEGMPEGVPEGMDFEEMSNLSPEERMERMQELRESGDLPERTIDRSADSAFIQGEIIDKDETSITVKLSDNSGSKLVFYSASTQIMKKD